MDYRSTSRDPGISIAVRSSFPLYSQRASFVSPGQLLANQILTLNAANYEMFKEHTCHNISVSVQTRLENILSF